MLHEKFQKVEDEYFKLKGRLSAGRITTDEFEAAMKELMVEHEGRYWVIGGKSGCWHVHDGSGWAEAEPPAGTHDAACPAEHDVGARGGRPARFSASEVMQFKPTLAGMGLDVECVAFSADGRHGLTSGGKICVWNLVTGREYSDFQESAYASAAALSPSGSHVLGGGTDKILRVWEVATRRLVRRFEGHTDFITGVAFSADSRHAFSCSHDTTIRRWDLETGREDRRYEGHQAPIVDLALTSAGSILASMAGDRTVRFWEVESGREHQHVRLQLDENYDEGLAQRFAVSDRHVLTCSLLTESVSLWDLVSREKIRELAGHTGNVWDVALSPDGRLAFTCGVSDFVELEVRARVGLDNVVRVWDVESGEEVGRLEGHTAGVACVAVSADGKFALTGGRDKTARLWAL